MKHVILGVSAILGAIVIGSARENPSATNTIPEASPVEAAPEQSYEGMVVAIEVGEKSLMDLRKFKEWATVLARAEKEKARAVVFRIDAGEGYVRETEKLMGQVANLEVPSYALIEGTALGAGALLALSTQTIYVTPESLIGGGRLAGWRKGGGRGGEAAAGQPHARQDPDGGCQTGACPGIDSGHAGGVKRATPLW